MHLSTEIAAAVFRIYEGGPSHLAAHHRFRRTSLTAKGTTGARLVLQKTRREQEKEEEEYYASWTETKKASRKLVLLEEKKENRG